MQNFQTGNVVMQKKEIVLDTSELEAPEPLIKATIALDELEDEEVLIFKHRMDPKHLYNEIAARGLMYEIVKNEPNDFIMKIWRK